MSTPTFTQFWLSSPALLVVPTDLSLLLGRSICTKQQVSLALSTCHKKVGIVVSCRTLDLHRRIGCESRFVSLFFLPSSSPTSSGRLPVLNKNNLFIGRKICFLASDQFVNYWQGFLALSLFPQSFRHLRSCKNLAHNFGLEVYGS